jgi:hypothetical protein
MQLLQLPVLPLFIFDGDRRPKLKRGKAVRGNNHWITQDMQAMLDAFGFAWLKVSVAVPDLSQQAHAHARLLERPKLS